MKNIIKTCLVFCLFISINTNAQKMKTVASFNHLESVATDGKFIYAADIGKELNATTKHVDGQILKLDKKEKF